jgi:GDP-L-fucose synthase
MLKKVLVTGGWGMVGMALQDYVFTIQCKEYEWFFLSREDGDLRIEGDVERMFSQCKPQIVIHLGAKVGGLYSNMDDNFQFFMDNMKINISVAEACRRHSVSCLVNVLSTCIFPDNLCGNKILRFNDMHSGTPHTSNIGYAYAKRMMHIAGSLLDNTVVVNVIPTNLYGKDDKFDIVSGHVIPAIIKNMYEAQLTKTPMKVRGDGSAQRQFVYAGDLARILYLCCDRENSFDCIIGPSQESEICVSELVKMIKDISKWDVNIEFDTSMSNGQHSKTVDDYDVRQYFPSVELTTLYRGLQLTIEAFLEKNT